MAFVKDGNFDAFKRDVELNFNNLEERVIELEKLLKQYNGGVAIEEVPDIEEPEVVVEPEVVEDEEEEDVEVEEDVTDEYSQPLSEEDEKEDNSPKGYSNKKK